MKRQQALEIKDWYRQLKTTVSCAYCDRQGIDKHEDKFELHHIKPETKREAVSHMIFPVPYDIVTVAVEMMKVVPLHASCHAELHRIEREDPKRFGREYDMLHDPLYIGLIQKFRATVIDTMPQQQQIIDYMFDRGFQP